MGGKESNLELNDAAKGLAGNSLNNLCDLTFSTHCSSNVTSKVDPGSINLTANLKSQDGHEQNKDQDVNYK